MMCTCVYNLKAKPQHPPLRCLMYSKTLTSISSCKNSLVCSKEHQRTPAIKPWWDRLMDISCWSGFWSTGVGPCIFKNLAPNSFWMAPNTSPSNRIGLHFPPRAG